ncbi:hypothetical protein Drose_06355 [Dactylosporangium roseum]|uniref:Uncharacterized protein n=1 Tax=Dactylosporangium roseum TaxID=47989 RepID=A0ABY5Z8B7_9ACTN|nr:hypothetical protein [Dactylosporangium roseum]UWZ37894.1 hypothetical protein Drose_06355 [Dactylosporangium roseum]
MATVTHTVNSELLIESIVGERLDVSALRDFVRELDAVGVADHVLVDARQSGTGHLVQMLVRLTKTTTGPYPVGRAADVE